MKTSILLTSLPTKDAAAPLIAALNGQSYMNLIVEVCPCEGSFHVNVGTNRPKTTKAKLTEMVLGVLADVVRLGGTQAIAG